MDKKTEALKLALELLAVATYYSPDLQQKRSEVIDAGLKALAEKTAQQQEPYGWKVYGVNSLFVGEFAEADAKAEAKRIGGTCIAFPLYTSPQPAPQQVTEDLSDFVTSAVKTRMDVWRQTTDAYVRAHPQPGKPPTDEQITAGARALCKQMAEACGVDGRDQWQLYSDTFKEDAKAVLEAAHGIKEKNT